jgi:hypothetical protein
MLNSLYKYFILHDHVGVPGIGNFTIERSSAEIIGNTIEPAKPVILFSPGSALTDKQFYQFLSLETGLSEVDSVRKFQDFAYQLRKDIQSNPFVTLKGFGTLKRNATGNISFEPAVTIDKYFSSLTALPLEKKEEEPSQEYITEENGIEVYTEDEVITKDRWWIWALILAVLALGVVGYFYMQGDII